MSVGKYSQTKQALGGDVELTIIIKDSIADSIHSIFSSLWQQVYDFERRFSRFLPHSELSELNKNAGLKTPISPEFYKLLLTSHILSNKTNGLYNPFILPALHRSGYVQSALPGYENDPQTSYANRSIVDANKLHISESQALIPYGTALDMGGCGKGYLADQLGNYLRDITEVMGYWLSLSGDIATHGKDEYGSPITVGIQSAKNANSASNWTIICPEEPFGIATSGTFRRENQNHDKPHIIDPRTGQSADTDILLATICASDTITADVLASCAVILGSDHAPNFLSKLGISDFLLQYKRAGKHLEIVSGHTIRQNKKVKIREM